MISGQFGRLNSVIFRYPEVKFSLLQSWFFSTLLRCLGPTQRFYKQDFLFMNFRNPSERTELVFDCLDFIDIISGS